MLLIKVNKEILFPYSYPYTSSTTKILRENFADLYKETKKQADREQPPTNAPGGDGMGSGYSDAAHAPEPY